jgi:iron complex outermembrane receptor protein
MHYKNKLAAAIAVLMTTGSGHTFAQQDTGSRHLALEEIVVTAQRRSENIQDVPMTITAITADQLADYNLTSFKDVQNLSPGLSMSSPGGADGAVAQLRGVGYDSNSSASAPAVDVYFNETPVDANYAFQSIYDIGQVEVLRGPQGTLRGRPAPAGAITFSSRRPDMNSLGATVITSASNHGSINSQVAVNLPLIEDKLALRVATLYDENEGTRIKSVNTGYETDRDTKSYRISLAWEPTDNLDVLLTHQRLKVDFDNPREVRGPGGGINGPAINRRGYSVMESRASGEQEAKLITANINWDLGDHVLSYIGGWQDNSFDDTREWDITNAATGFIEAQHTVSSYKIDTHELKLESSGDQAIDYVVGLWYSDLVTDTQFTRPAALIGAFPVTQAGGVAVGPANPDYVINTAGDLPISGKEWAIYSNASYAFTDATTLSVGLRYLETEESRSQTITGNPALTAIPISPGTPFRNCTAITGVSETYPGYCDFAVPALLHTDSIKNEFQEVVYNVSLKHHFTDDLMTYLTYGTSWRPAGVTVGISSPVTSDLIQGEPEESKSLELGLRSTWMDGRMRFNASIFRQEFDNFIGRFNQIPYAGPGGQNQLGEFTYSGDALVDGVEMELAYEISENWSMNLSAAYADGRYDDASVPCRDTDGNGVPDDGPAVAASFAPGQSVNYCTADYSISTMPPWSAVLQSEYRFDVLSNQGYVRALYNYYAQQDNLAASEYEADAYGVLNLYAGVRSADGKWDVGLWVKNAFDEDTQLKKGPYSTSFDLYQSGYHEVGYVPEREFGVSVRYTFGEG